MGTVVLDASALIAFANDDDALHDVADRLAARWRAPGITRLLPASAYSEYLVGPLRAGKADVAEAIVRHADITVVPLDREVARVAAEACSQRPSLRLPDALVIAT